LANHTKILTGDGDWPGNFSPLLKRTNNPKKTHGGKTMKKLLLLVALALSLGLAAVGCKPAVVEPESSFDAARDAFLNQHVYFDYDRYNIRPDQVSVINAKADYLKANAAAKVEIEGHCDERGSETYNNALADRRAISASNYLASQGIESSRLSTVSYGEERPIDTGHNEAAWAKNRRAQFVLK
jgi:peptidoglycan-associated lipoprotein